MQILCIGDVVGSHGCDFLRRTLPAFKRTKGIDVVIANGENSSDGNGITPASANHLLDSGVDIITTGNHTYRRREFYDYIDESDCVIRPANFPPEAPSPYTVSFALTWLRQKSRQGNSSGGRGFLRLTPQGYESELRWLLASLEVARRNQLRGNGASFVNSLQGYWAEFIFSRYRLSVLRVPLLGLSFLSRYNGLQEF